MPMRRRVTLILAVLTAVLVSSAAESSRADSSGPAWSCDVTCGDIYVIAVGVDDAIDIPVEYAVSDARRFATRIEADTLLVTRLGPDSVVTTRSGPTTFLLTGGDATLEGIRATFQRLMELSGPDDVVYFYFSGASVQAAPGGGVAETYLCVHGSRCVTSDPTQAPTAALHVRELKQLLDNLPARYQAVVVDAGFTRDFALEFARLIAETDPTSAALLERERVIVAPSSVGFEFAELEGGVLTHWLVRYPRSLLQALFVRSWRGWLQQHLSRLELEEAREMFLQADGYGSVVYESDMLRVLAATAGAGPASSRGIGVAGATDEPDTREPSAMPRGYALVVGTNNYDAPEWATLANPVLDARTLATELENSYGFEVYLLIDPTKHEVMQAILELKRHSFDQRDQLLLFFAGHGHYDEDLNMGYLVTRDSRPLAEDPWKQSYISYGELAPYVDGLAAEHILLALDVCFGGTFSSDIRLAGSRSGEYQDLPVHELIERKADIRTRRYFTSGGKEYVPDGVPGRHSPFASRLIAALRTYGGDDGLLTLSEVTTRLETIDPTPRAGGFGTDQPGSDFLLVAR